MTKRQSKKEDPDLLPIDSHDDWEIVAVGNGVPRPIGARITVRLDPVAYKLVGDAADQEGTDTIEFARRAIVQAAEAALARSPHQADAAAARAEVSTSR